MKLKTKKYVFTGLVLVTVGATVGGAFVTPIFALAGTALIGTIAIGKLIVRHKQDEQHHQGAPQQNMTPNSDPHPIQAPTLTHNNLSPPSLALASWVEEKKEELVKPAMGRDFSMHIEYKTNQHSPGGTISPDAINVSVHTRSPDGSTGSHQATPTQTQRRVIPSPIRLSRKLTIPGDI